MTCHDSGRSDRTSAGMMGPGALLSVPVLLLGLLCCGLFPDVSACEKEPETPDWRMTLRTIRNGIHKIDTYLNVALDLFGGDDGLCRYTCSDGESEDFTAIFLWFYASYDCFV